MPFRGLASLVLLVATVAQPAVSSQTIRGDRPTRTFEQRSHCYTEES